MDTPDADAPHLPPPSAPPGRPRFRPGALPVWLLVCACGGVLTGAAAAVAGAWFHPAVVFPLLVGVVLGAAVVLLMRASQTGHRPTVVTGAVLAAVCCAGAQHYFSYRSACRRHDRAVADSYQKTQMLLQAPPEFARALLDRVPPGPGTFGQYMLRQAREGRPVGPWLARGWLAWLSWSVDGLLAAGAALALVAASMRLPYCDRCRSWYRTVRAGRLSPESARRLALAAAIDLPSEHAGRRFRLQHCTGGCGPARLEVFWEDPQGGLVRRRAWVGPAQREQVHGALDQPDAAPDAPTTDRRAQDPHEASHA